MRAGLHARSSRSFALAHALIYNPPSGERDERVRRCRGTRVRACVREYINAAAYTRARLYIASHRIRVCTAFTRLGDFARAGSVTAAATGPSVLSTDGAPSTPSDRQTTATALRACTHTPTTAACADYSCNTSMTIIARWVELCF